MSLIGDKIIKDVGKTTVSRICTHFARTIRKPGLEFLLLEDLISF